MGKDDLGHDPSQQIQANNQWYVGDQFANQMGSEGRRALIDFRWSFFERCVLQYARSNTVKGNRGQLSILDAGCGDGINLAGLGRIIEKNALDAMLTGIDYNPLRLSRSKTLAGVHGPTRGSLYDLPFGDGVFDIVLCNHVLEHLHEDVRALNELNRVLKNGGVLILGVPNEGCMLAYLRNHVIQRSILRTTDHVNFYTMREINSLLTDAGFAVMNSETENFFFPHGRMHYLLIERRWGRGLIRLLRSIFPSQAGGLILYARKSPANF